MVAIENNNRTEDKGWTKGSKRYFNFVFSIVFQVQINMQNLKF